MSRQLLKTLASRGCLLNRCSTANLGVCQFSNRFSSKSAHSPADNDKGVQVGRADDNTFVCWHPEPSFPYEHTKPMPRNISEIAEGESVLRVQHLTEFKNRYRPDGPTKDELEKIFFTAKHHFRPRPRERRHRDLNPPKDRDGI